MDGAGLFDIGFGIRMVEVLEQCRDAAESIEKSQRDETRLKLTAAMEKRRCRRAWWQMQATAEELTQELTYCRIVLQCFRGSSAKLEVELRNSLNEAGDDLVDLY